MHLTFRLTRSLSRVLAFAMAGLAAGSPVVPPQLRPGAWAAGLLAEYPVVVSVSRQRLPQPRSPLVLQRGEKWELDWRRAVLATVRQAVRLRQRRSQALPQAPPALLRQQ